MQPEPATTKAEVAEIYRRVPGVTYIGVPEPDSVEYVDQTPAQTVVWLGWGPQDCHLTHADTLGYVGESNERVAEGAD